MRCAPESIASGDFNGDGVMDLATSESEFGDVTLLLGEGDGSFDAGERFRVEGYVTSMVSGDFNRDERLDLAVAAFQSTDVTLLFGDGNGGFESTHGFRVYFEPSALLAGDLNGDRALDLLAVDRQHDDVAVLLNRLKASSESNRNGIPDECEVPFRRGDIDDDGQVNVADAIKILVYLFGGDPSVTTCEDAADSDDNGNVEMADAVYLLSYLFLGGPLPREPFNMCLVDETVDELSCVRFSGCE